jgi:hypothetical protein
LIPPHCEREQFAKPSYADLRPRVDTGTLLSFLLPVALPEAGGALVVYDMAADDPRAAEVLRTRAWAHGPIPTVPSVTLEASAGDLVIFDGGRRFHQVLRVDGPRPRWTIGGFLGARRDGQGCYAWS